MHKTAAAGAALVLAIGANGPAQAWGGRGHEYIGNLAWELLTDTARGKVGALLGKDDQGRPITLAMATVWPDCIRSVNEAADGTFSYAGGGGATCEHLAGRTGEVAAMIDYAKRNWTQCEYSHRPKECHRSYHFTNVAIQHPGYTTGLYGTGPQDVVHAIRSAVLKLEGQQPVPPFNIASEREALYMLAHFVGDLHQPLHAGSVYLTRAGQRRNPDTYNGDKRKLETAGGNFIKFGSKNMHGDWDGIGLDETPDEAAICAALEVPTVDGALLDKPKTWATESVRAARDTAFRGVRFGPNGNGWKVTFQDRGGYIDSRTEVQEERLVLAAARLAEVLNALYPGNRPIHNCS